MIKMGKPPPVLLRERRRRQIHPRRHLRLPRSCETIVRKDDERSETGKVDRVAELWCKFFLTPVRKVSGVLQRNPRKKHPRPAQEQRVR